MMRSIVKKLNLTAVALGMVIALGGATAASANDRCDRRIAHEQHQLDKAIARHGYNSPQADHERRVLDQIHADCGYR